MPSNLKTILGQSEHVLVLAADHRYFGVVAGLERPARTLDPLLPYVDVLMTDPGTRRHCLSQGLEVPVILRASGCTSTMDVPVSGCLQEPAKLAYEQRTGRNFDQSYREYKAKVENGTASLSEFEQYRNLDSILNQPDTIADERLILTAENVLAEGGSAAAVSVYLRTRYQSQTLDNLATMSRQATAINLPVLGVVAVGNTLGYLEKDSDFLTRAGAILVAHGADIVKTYNCGKNFERVVEACGVPVIVAGGKVAKGEDGTRSSLELAYDSIQKGARGIDFGRRIWRHESPVSMIQALRAVVHEAMPPAQAYEMFQELNGASNVSA
jgi:DhnA family fructose-bisphosphate aldolase class Ia